MKKIFGNEISELIRIVRSSNFYKAILIVREPYSIDEHGDQCWEEELYWNFGEDWGCSVIDNFGGGFKAEPEKKVTDDELKERLQNLGDKDEVYLTPAGTHCGRLKFMFGWVHDKTKSAEEIEDAVMPQHG